MLLIPATVAVADGTEAAANSAPAATPPCLVDAEHAGPLNVGLLAAPAGNAIEATCRRGRLESLSIVLAPGKETTIELGVTSRAGRAHEIDIVAVAAAGASTSWLTVQGDLERVASDQPLPVVLQVHASDLEPETTHHLLLEFSLADGERRPTVGLPVTLNIAQEQPLFRNRFEVDPVLGQFSYRSSTPRHRPGTTAGPVAAGTGE